MSPSAFTNSQVKKRPKSGNRSQNKNQVANNDAGNCKNAIQASQAAELHKLISSLSDEDVTPVRIILEKMSAFIKAFNNKGHSRSRSNSLSITVLDLSTKNQSDSLWTQVTRKPKP